VVRDARWSSFFLSDEPVGVTIAMASSRVV
jgi:hypothetical protein